MNGLKIFIFPFLLIFSSLSQAQLPYRLSVSLSKMVDFKTMAPGDFTYFTNFRSLAINQNGHFAFVGDTKSGQGVYTNLTGPLTVVADQNTLMPGNKDRRFLRFSGGDSLVMSYDRIVFIGNHSLYQYQPGKITKIADFNTQVPGDTSTFMSFSQTQMTNDGTTYFLADDVKNHEGVYEYTNDGQLKALLPSYSKIPHSDDHFVNISSFDVSPLNQDVAFVGGRQSDAKGLYLYHQGTVSTLVDKNMRIPHGVGYFSDINKPDFGDSGELAFIGKGILGQSGLYYYLNHQVTRLVDQRTQLPQITGFFGQIYQVSIDRGNIVFYGSDYHEDGIYLYSPQGIFKIISTRDAIGDKGIYKLSLGQGFDGKHLGVIVTFDGGAQAIYILTIELKH